MSSKNLVINFLIFSSHDEEDQTNAGWASEIQILKMIQNLKLFELLNDFQKVSNFGTFHILDFQIRNAQW